MGSPQEQTRHELRDNGSSAEVNISYKLARTLLKLKWETRPWNFDLTDHMLCAGITINGAFWRKWTVNGWSTSSSTFPRLATSSKSIATGSDHQLVHPSCQIVTFQPLSYLQVVTSSSIVRSKPYRSSFYNEGLLRPYLILYSTWYYYERLSIFMSSSVCCVISKWWHLIWGI